MSNRNETLPRGCAFFEAISAVEGHCSTESQAELPKLGISAPACYERLGDLMSLLYAEAACFHGCPGGDHHWQRITARVVTHSLSSLRLALLGYYDEALSLTRSIGEIANLLFLFAASPDSEKSWRLSDDATRRKAYSPFKVRSILEGMKLRPPVDKDRYGLLCEIGVHITPSVSPQTFNEHGRSTLGAKFQYEGLICALNELGPAVAECAGSLSIFPTLAPADNHYALLLRRC